MNKIYLLLVICCGCLIACKDSGASSNTSNISSTTSFTNQHTRLVGRFDFTEANKARFTWSGSALEFRFEGTNAQLRIDSNDRARFEVDIDGDKRDLWISTGDKVYVLASDLNPGPHDVRLTRITESFGVITAFMSDPLVDGHLLPPPAARARRLLVIGDSITAGYGVEGENQSCSYTHETSNQQLTYAALAAQALGADLHSVAWSGIGAWRSYGEVTPINPNILVRYQRTLADVAESSWDVSQFQPKAVLINIGTNDYWQGSASDDYRLGMQSLINRIQTDYPQAPIYLIASAMLGGDARVAQISVLSSLTNDQVHLLDLGKIEAADGLGCDYHPNRVTQTRMGQALRVRLAADLSW